MSRLFSKLMIRNTFIVLMGAIVVGVGVAILNGNPKTSEPLDGPNEVEITNTNSEMNELGQINVNIPKEEPVASVGDSISDTKNNADALHESTDEIKNAIEVAEPIEDVVSKPLVTYNTIIRKSKIDFDVVTQNDASLEAGNTYVKSEGIHGEKSTTIKQEYHDGKLISEVIVKEEISKQVVDKVIVNGTKPIVSNIIERRDLVMESFNSQNDHRVSNGLAPLTWNETLYQNALVRSKEITHTWSHTRPNGSTPFTAITVPYRTAGENIALTSSQGSNLGLRFTQMWINSESHRLSIVKPEFTSAAVSIVEIGGILYATTLFIG